MASSRSARRGPLADGPTGIPDPIAGPDGRRRRGPPAAPVGQAATAQRLPPTVIPSGVSPARGPRGRTSAPRSIATPPRNVEGTIRRNEFAGDRREERHLGGWL